MPSLVGFTAFHHLLTAKTEGLGTIAVGDIYVNVGRLSLSSP